MDVEVVPLLMESSYQDTFVWIDDCYLTGVLREMSGVPIYSMRRMYVFNNKLFNQTMIGGDRIFLHDSSHDVTIIKLMWEALHSGLIYSDLNAEV